MALIPPPVPQALGAGDSPTFAAVTITGSLGAGSAAITGALGAGSAAITGALGADSANVANLLQAGQAQVSQIGKTLGVHEGLNAKMGVATLVNGTVTVNTSAVAANSRIFFAVQTKSATVLGTPYKGAVVAGVSFQILSNGSADNSTVAWWILDPL